MRNSNKLTDSDVGALDLLDWEKRPKDFERFCEFTLRLLEERDGLTRRRLFAVLPEEDFRRELRASVEGRTESGWRLAAYGYFRMKLLVLPRAVRKGKV
jgi:hypothetical protein